MTHKTKGIVLRTVKYGETSLIAGIYTELFGMQSFMVNGVRAVSKKGSTKANLFQPGALLEMVVYHNDLKNLQRLKEYKWAYLYEQIFFDIRKNAVALFMIELLQKCLKQPEPNADLFYFIEDAFIHLDKAGNAEAANYSLFFALQLAGFLGFRIQDDYSEINHVLDLQEGRFIDRHPTHTHFLDEPYSHATSQLLRVMQPHELEEIKLNQEMRRNLLYAFQMFYALHVQEFGNMKTVPVLQEIMG